MIRCFSVLAVTFLVVISAQSQSLTGTVKDAFSETPIDGARVLLVGTLYAGVASTDGTYVITTVPAGEYELLVTYPGYESVTESVVIKEDETTILPISLFPEFGELPSPPVSGYSWQQSEVERSLHEALGEGTSVQFARRSLHDYAPVVRGMRGAQVSVLVDGVRSMSGSPLGPSLYSLLLPYNLEVVNGPYALVFGTDSFSSLFITTPFINVFATEAGFRTGPSGYDAAAVIGSVRPVYAYEVAGRHGMSQSYHDPVFSDLSVMAVKGRGRIRTRSAELYAWAGYEGRGKDISQLSTASRLAWQIRRPWIRSIQLEGSWQQREFSGWPYRDSGLHEERLATASARIFLRPGEDWDLVVGMDGESTRYQSHKMDQAGIYVYGAMQKGSLTYSGAIRGQTILNLSTTLLSMAAGIEVTATPEWTVTSSIGTAARMPGIYERLVTIAPAEALPFKFAVPGNPELHHERVFQLDVGVHRGYSTSVTLYGQRLTRRTYIDALDRDYPVHAQENTSYVGGEVKARLQLVGELLHTRIQVAFFGHPRKGLSGAPHLTSRAVLVIQAPADLFTLEASAKGMTATRFDFTTEEYRVPAYMAFDLQLQFRLLRNFSIVMGAENITDHRFGRPFSGLSAKNEMILEPGRQWYLRVRRSI